MTPNGAEALDIATLAAPMVIAVIAVVPRRSWRLLRIVVTIVHEGGHVLTALLVGRRLSGVRLHTDASGLTVSRGRSTGPGMVAMYLSGYTAPCIAGLLITALVAAGWHATALVIAVALLAGLLLAIRNVFGFLVIVATGGALVALSRLTSVEAQRLGASVLAWFLVLGGLRAVGELPSGRRADRAQRSDADQLARLTHIPAVLWIAVFFVIAVASAAASTALLVSA